MKIVNTVLSGVFATLLNLKKFCFQYSFILLGLILSTGCAGQNMAPKAVQGVLDLSQWNFKTHPVVTLDGEWAFHWQRLLAPDQFPANPLSSETVYMRLPGFWNRHPKGAETYPRDGFATFRLRVRLPEGAGGLGLKLGNVYAAYCLWINRVPGAAVGRVGRTREETVPFQAVRLIRLDPAQELELVLQVANFHYPNSGVADRISLGSESVLAKTGRIRFGLGLILFGGLVVMGIYHLAMFGLRSNDRSSLYFGLFCFSMAIWQQATGPHVRFIDALLPGLSWNIYIRADLFAAWVSVPLLYMFLRALFPLETSRTAARIFIVVAALLGLVVILAPGHIVTRTLKPFQIMAMLATGCALWGIIRASRRKREGSRIILLGFLAFALAAVNDLLYDYRIIHTVLLIPLGILVMIVSNAFVISLRFSNTFSALQKLSGQIQEKNIELSRLDKVKDEFLANTTHELKTPLNGIIGITESLIAGAAGRMPDKARADLAMVAAGGKRLANLINDILDFSRLRNRDIRLEKKAVDIRALTDVVLTVSEALLHDRGPGRRLVLKNEIPEGLPPVLGDEDRLQQVLYNLVGNAIKFTEKGEVCVSAGIEEGMLAVRVQDTGIGISETDLERIFNEFEQVDGAATRQFSGTGLGLSITRRLVHLHGGKIRVASEPGRGTCFTLTLPVCEPAVDVGPALQKVSRVLPAPILFEPKPEPAGSPPAADEPDRPRVLVVDDDPVNLQVVVNYLALARIQARTCISGPEALAEVAENGKPDLVLLDIMMPGMSGYEVCRKLRQTWPAQELPVILLTAKNRVQDLVEGFEAGANDYLVKPFAGDELMARVDTHLKVMQSYRTLKENVRLRQELDRRAETEQDLRLTQQRLSGMLDTVDTAMLGVNEAGEIGFCNQPFETFLGSSSETLLGTALMDLFADDSRRKVQALWEKWLSGELPGNAPGGDGGLTTEVVFKAVENRVVGLSAVNLELEEERLLVFLIREQDTPVAALTLIETLNANRLRLRDLEASLNGMTPLVMEQHPEFIDELRQIDQALNYIQLAWGQDQGRDDTRGLIVQVMNLSLACWTEATGETKADLAAKSGIWKIYMTRDGYMRTQTLDKYLDLATLPRNPRRKQVIRTAEFVLEICKKGDMRQELAVALEVLKGIKK